METMEYIPRFVAIWSHIEDKIEISTVEEIISFEGMSVNLISQLEGFCANNNSLEEVVELLSTEWDKSELISLLDLLIEKKILVNGLAINPTLQDKKSEKIRTLVPNKETSGLLKLPYHIIYGKADPNDSSIWSSARDFDFNVACKKLIFEIAEWGAWSSSVERPTIVCDYFSILQCVHPDNIVAYHDTQYADKNFRLEKFDSSSIHEWVEGEDIISNEKVFFLADNILYPYTSNYAQHSFATSSGCAAHTKKTDAIQHAVYELLERDAFMIYWLNKLDLPSIEINSLPKKVQVRIASIQDFGYRIVLKDIGMGIVPVVIVAVQDKSGNYVTMGLGSSNNLLDTIHTAISETESALMHFLNLKEKHKTHIEPDEVFSLTQHEELHQQEKFKSQTGFIFDQSSDSISYCKLNSQYEIVPDIVQSVVNHGFSVYVVDATDWKLDLLLPEHRYIVRVIIPGLVPLSFGYNLEPLGMHRIYNVPHDLGYRENKIKFHELNRFPHPFN